MKNQYLLSLVLVTALYSLPLHGAVINVGGVAFNTATGYYLNSDGSLVTNGGTVLFGSFNVSQSALAAIIAGWTDSTPTYAKYTQLLSDFTEVGTGGANGTAVPGWKFSTNGGISGTSTNVDLSIFPAGTEMYAWSFNITNVGAGITNNSTNFTLGTEWGLYTAGTNTNTGWMLPSQGTKALNLSAVLNSGSGAYLIGSKAASNSTVGQYIVDMVQATVPEPSSPMLILIAAASLIVVLKIRKESFAS